MPAKKTRGQRDKPQGGKRYPLPHDSASLLREIGGIKKVENPGLIYERLGAYNTSKDKEWDVDKESVMKAVIDASSKISSILSKFTDRWRTILDAMGAQRFTASPRWRFVTGLGKGGPLEVGFVFHRIYGFPIIPGSSLKGMTRAYAELVLKPANRINEAEIERLFGKQEDAGDLIFFDAVPTGKVTLELDIMNPHYPNYYQGNEPPADWQNPTPIPFLTVGKGTEFIFAVGARRGTDVDLSEVMGWMKSALEEIGAGAKTTAGYGYFGNFKQEE